MSVLNDIKAAVLSGMSGKTKEAVIRALESGESPEDILERGLMPGMDAIGQRYADGTVLVPEVLMSSRAMYTGFAIVRPLLKRPESHIRARVLIGTVRGDLHDIGKNLVKLMLEGKGFEVIDLGVDVPPERFVSEALAQNCRFVCMSTLLTSTMCRMEDVLTLMRRRQVRNRFIVMVGGAPVTAEFATRIGADIYAKTAIEAARAAEAAIKKENRI